MSYGVEYYFIENIEPSSVFELIESIQYETLSQGVLNYINNSYNLTKSKNLNEFKEILKSSLTISFNYWEEYKLLGLFGEKNILDCLTYNKKYKNIYFQNSSDTNYSLDFYKNIPCFTDIYKKYINYSSKDFLNDSLVNELDLLDYIDTDMDMDWSIDDSQSMIFLVISRLFKIEQSIYYNKTDLEQISISIEISDRDSEKLYKEFLKVYNR